MIGFLVALLGFGRGRAVAKGAGEVAVVATGSGHGGVADDQVTVFYDQIGTHRFVVRT